MNVTINGYISFACNSCRKVHTLEGQSCKFEEDVSKEAEDDEYIRYVSDINTQCLACSSQIVVKVDVWEYPESVVNYCYYGEEGASDVECEFNIEHYFDDQAVNEEDIQYDELAENDVQHEQDPDDEEAEYAPPPIEVYVDRYDDDD